MRYTYVSEASLRVTGYTREEFLQKTVNELYGDAFAEKLFTLINDKIEQYKKEKIKDIEVLFEAQRPTKQGR
jgi:PAS domain-containing protein